MQRRDVSEGIHPFFVQPEIPLEQAMDEIADKIKELQEKYPSADIIVAPLSLSISCHIGPGSLAVTATRKMVEEYEVDQKQDRGILS